MRHQFQHYRLKEAQHRNQVNHWQVLKSIRLTVQQNNHRIK